MSIPITWKKAIEMKGIRKLLVLGCACPLAFQAQTVISLQDAVAKGLKNNYSIRMVENNKQIAANNNSAGNAGMLPNLFLTGTENLSVTNTRQVPFIGPERVLSGAKTTTINAGPQLSWTLFNGFQMFVEKGRLTRLEELGEIQFKSQVINTTASIIEAYTNLVQQQEKLKAFEEAISLSQVRVFISTQKAIIGSGSEYEQMKAQSDLNTDSTNYFRQMAAMKDAQASLLQVIADPSLAEIKADSLIPLNRQINTGDLQQQLFNGNFDILAAQKNLEALQAVVKSIKATRYPVISLNAGYGYNYQVSEAGFFQTNRQYGPNVGVTASIPIFTGFNINRTVNNAVLTAKNAELSLEETQLKVRTEFSRILIEYQNALSGVRIGQNNVGIARKNSEIAIEKFKIGSISSTELREVQIALENARVNFVTDLYFAKVLETELLKLSGNLIK